MTTAQPAAPRGETYADKPPEYYAGINMLVAWRLRGDHLRVLDVGCASGRLLEWLRAQGRLACGYGIEWFPAAAAEARKRLDYVWEGDAEQIQPDIPLQSLDYIVFADVLEHLKNPSQLIARLKPLLKPTGGMVISTPNVNFMGVLWDLIAHNEWRYQPSGLMDATHLRWFTHRSIARMFAEHGMAIDEFTYGFGSPLRRRICRVLPPLGRFLGEQMVFVARAASLQ
jgi:2-polyprenyl-3-methyl-5-hydroxy-6-metoxy-1,4-benzoquinol methylase